MPLSLTKSMQDCFLLLVEILPRSCYYDVENNSKGGTYMRKAYIDNIRWMTVVIVVTTGYVSVGVVHLPLLERLFSMRLFGASRF